jgi:hypothetical protein
MWRNKLPKAAASLVLMQAVLDRNATRREKLAHQSMLIEIRLAEGYSTVMLERQPKWYENIPNAS